MNDKIFVDTNIFVYAYTNDDPIKHNKVENIIRKLFSDGNSIISTQVLSEFYSAMTKYKIAHNDIIGMMAEIISASVVNAIALQTIEQCIHLKEKYRYSWWDSLILSSALENGCTHVYSEDMRHGQTVEGVLMIENPFSAAVP